MPGGTNAQAARAHGAVAVLAVPAERAVNFLRDKNFRERAAERESIGLAKNDEGGLPSAVLGPDLAEKILAPMALPVLGGLLISDEVVDLFLPVRFYWVRRARWLKLHNRVDTGHVTHSTP